MSFQDHFSTQAKSYAAFRPLYPAELFAYLAELAPAMDVAVDCGAGNGQASIALARHFAEVIAVEPSRAQVDQAAQHERVRFVVAPAETIDLDDSTVDVITCANAIHWFDLDRFYPEARRVLKPGGVIAAWCYHFASISPDIDPIVRNYATEILSGYWSPRIDLVNDHYQTLPFPFEEITTPSFVHESQLTLADYIGYLSSWSATRAYMAAKGDDPLVDLHARLEKLWGEGGRLMRLQLYLRVGRNR